MSRHIRRLFLRGHAGYYSSYPSDRALQRLRFPINLGPIRREFPQYVFRPSSDVATEEQGHDSQGVEDITDYDVDSISLCAQPNELYGDVPAISAEDGQDDVGPHKGSDSVVEGTQRAVEQVQGDNGVIE